jgi:hypothetical protein
MTMDALTMFEAAQVTLHSMAQRIGTGVEQGGRGLFEANVRVFIMPR